MHFEASIELDVDAATAWRVLGDHRRDPDWRHEVVSMIPTPDGPAQVGTTTVEVARVLGSTFTTPGAVVAVDPGRRMAWCATSDAIDAAGERIVEPLGGGRCRVRLTYELRGKGATRLAMPLLSWAFRRSVRRNLRGLPAIATEPAATQPRTPQPGTRSRPVREALGAR